MRFYHYTALILMYSCKTENTFQQAHDSITGTEIEKNILEVQAKKQNRHLLPEQTPEVGSYFRSDHFNFTKVGVPALYAKGGNNHVEHGKEWAKEQNSKWRKERYHQPQDEYIPGEINSEGMKLDARLLFMVGYELSNMKTFPAWKEGSGFKAIREKSF